MTREGSQGGELSFGFQGAPVRLPILVKRLDPPRAITWECPGAFPYWEGTTISWTLDASEHGTKVVFRHDGFSDSQPEFDLGSVNLTWGKIVARLKDVVESGVADPALS